MLKKLLVIISLFLLVGCNDEGIQENQTEEVEEEKIEKTTERKKETRPIEKGWSNEITPQQEETIRQVAYELQDSLTLFDVSYSKESNTLKLTMADTGMIREYQQAINGNQVFVDAYRSLRDTLMSTSEKVVRDSGVVTLGLEVLAPSTDMNDYVKVFRFENGQIPYDQFRQLGLY